MKDRKQVHGKKSKRSTPITKQSQGSYTSKKLKQKITPYAKEGKQNDDPASQQKEIHSKDNYDT